MALCNKANQSDGQSDQGRMIKSFQTNLLIFLGQIVFSFGCMSYVGIPLLRRGQGVQGQTLACPA